MRNNRESGSYTIEACVSLLFFLVTVYIVFLQINTMIVENVLQKAVDSFATEISGYSYILDRAGLIVNHGDDDGKHFDEVYHAGEKTVEESKEAYNKFFGNSDSIGDFVAGLYSNPESVKDSATSVGDAFKEFLGSMKSVTKEDWAGLAKEGVEQVLKGAISLGCTSYCNSQIENGAYLPMSHSDFCRVYHIDKNNFTFGASFMPGDTNNSVLIWVKCDVLSPFSLQGFGTRTVVKTAYCPLWVK